MQSRFCPALLITAPASHHGKTMVTAALARFYTRQGLKVRVFKAGPDFLDPMIHEQASAQPVYQLDLWLAGEHECKRLLYEAAQTADLILIEGVMGLFDGKPSSADLAELFGIPVLAVIDVKGMAQTLGALGLGLMHYRPSLNFFGVLANSIASPRHGEMVAAGIPLGLKYCGGMMRSNKISLPERHLGLVQAQEVPNLEASLNATADMIALTDLHELPHLVEFSPAQPEALSPMLAGVKIGIARDAAFSFIYQANLDLLQGLGAHLVFFSPLADHGLPDIDSLYLPGGYPELHLTLLQANVAMQASIQQHCAEKKPIYAECGGMLYLLQSLTDQHGSKADMTGILPGHAVMQPRLQGLGYQTAAMPGGAIRSHTFHHSKVQTTAIANAYGERLYNTSAGEPIFVRNRLVASYLHCYFPANPSAAAQLFKP